MPAQTQTISDRWHLPISWTDRLPLTRRRVPSTFLFQQIEIMLRTTYARYVETRLQVNWSEQFIAFKGLK